jgi:hypothetical protein
MDEEELHWYKRSYENWLLKGDNNTEFFHRIASGKRRKQTLFSLMDGDKRLARTDIILNHATDYYKMLFGPGVSKRKKLSWLCSILKKIWQPALMGCLLNSNRDVGGLSKMTYVIYSLISIVVG